MPSWLPLWCPSFLPRSELSTPLLPVSDEPSSGLDVSPGGVVVPPGAGSVDGGVVTGGVVTGGVGGVEAGVGVGTGCCVCGGLTVVEPAGGVVAPPVGDPPVGAALPVDEALAAPLDVVPAASPFGVPDEPAKAGVLAVFGFVGAPDGIDCLAVCVPSPFGALETRTGAAFGSAGAVECFGAARPGACVFPCATELAGAACVELLWPGTLADCDFASPGCGDMPCFARPGLDTGFPCLFAWAFGVPTSVRDE